MLLFSCIDKGESKESVKSVTIQEISVEEEKEEPPPPAPTVNLKAFNIFVIKPADIYYYYDHEFRETENSSKYTTENLKEALVHKSDFSSMRKMVDSLVRNDFLKNNQIWLAVEGYDAGLQEKAFKEVLTPAGITQATVGYISDELYTLLKSTH